MRNKKKCYQLPITAVCRMTMSAQVLAGSPEEPAAAPEVNAQRNGYGAANAHVW